MDEHKELALDALMTTLDNYGGVWGGDWRELRNDLLSPLVDAIMTVGAEDSRPEGASQARQVLRDAAGGANWGTTGGE